MTSNQKIAIFFHRTGSKVVLSQKKTFFANSEYCAFHVNLLDFQKIVHMYIIDWKDIPSSDSLDYVINQLILQKKWKEYSQPDNSNYQLYM